MTGLDQSLRHLSNQLFLINVFFSISVLKCRLSWLNIKIKCVATCKILMEEWYTRILDKYGYRTRAIITRGLYIYYPLFENPLFVFKEVFSENSVVMYG